jgi:hypothetical protein
MDSIPRSELTNIFPKLAWGFIPVIAEVIIDYVVKITGGFHKSQAVHMLQTVETPINRPGHDKLALTGAVRY